MVILAFPSPGIEQHPSLFRGEESAPHVSEPLSLPPRGGPALRLLTTPDELAAAVERAQAFERRNAEQLATRANRYAAALARSSQSGTPLLKGDQ